MKIQCSCGAKHMIDVTSDMAGRPVRFVCPACGLDASDYVTSLVHQQLGSASASVTSASGPASGGLRIQASRPAHAEPVSARVETSDEPKPCSKHPSELAEEKCFICSKPICPECMAVFGYICSPLCRAKANSNGIEIPVYEGQQSVRDALLWRRTVWAVGITTTAIVLVLSVYGWFIYFGSMPKATFAVRFPERVHSGQSHFAGHNQIVFLRGGTLARYDMETKKEIWSSYLINKAEIAKAVSKTITNIEALIYKANNEAWEHVPKMPSRESLTRNMERSEAAAMDLRVRGKNIWIVSPSKVSRFDFETGKLADEIPVKTRYGEIIPRGEEFLLVEQEESKPPVITHINLDTCQSHTEDLDPSRQSATNNSEPPQIAGVLRRPRNSDLAGLPLGTPGKDGNKPLDPAKVAQQVQHMSLPQKLALPAVLSNARVQERELNELNSQDRTRPAAVANDSATRDGYSLIPTTNGFLQFSVHLLERKIVTHTVARPPKGKSALDGPTSVANSTAVANEILNEMQRERGGDVIEEDESRFRVTLRRPDGQDSWTGEVVGYPSVYPLQTVNVLAAKKMLVVFDKANKKLWQSTLTYSVEGDLETLDSENAPYGVGPCAEHKDALFVFDAGVLTAFDLKTGNVRWRFPSVGITGMFFDDKDALYVNTTSAGFENLKFSREIDISRKDTLVVLKLDSRTGKKFWSSEPGGLVNYVSGKFLYTVQFYQPYEGDEDDPYQPEDNTPPYMRIKRINPKTGRVMWEHFQQRAPLDVQFDKNTIRLVFRKEVQVLRFLTL